VERHRVEGVYVSSYSSYLHQVINLNLGQRLSRVSALVYVHYVRFSFPILLLLEQTMSCLVFICLILAIFAVLTSVLPKEDWWNLLLKAIYTLSDLARFQEAELLVDSSLEYYSFYDDRQKRKELEYFGLSAAILDKNFRKAYDYIR
jgi:hypothetical protein